MYKSKFEKLFDIELVQEWDNPSGWSIMATKIYWCVHNDKIEGEKALELFNKMPENSIIEIASKLQVAEVLSEHKFSEVTDFLFKIAHSKIDKVTFVQDDIENEWSDLANKVEAAVYLIRMDDTRGKKILLDLERNLTSKFISMTADLLSYSYNKISIKLYFYFIDKYDFIEQEKEDLYFENKLNKNINQILNEYVYRGRYYFLFNIKKLAMDSKKEFKNLIELFQVMPEGSADFIEEKVSVAKILVKLGDKLEIRFLIRLIDCTLDKIAKTQSDRNVIRRCKKNSSILLIELENKAGKDFFRNLVKKEKGRSRGIMVDSLLWHATKNSIAFLVELSKEFPEVKEYCKDKRVKKIIDEMV